MTYLFYVEYIFYSRLRVRHNVSVVKGLFEKSMLPLSAGMCYRSENNYSDFIIHISAHKMKIKSLKYTLKEVISSKATDLQLYEN